MTKIGKKSICAVIAVVMIATLCLLFAACDDENFIGGKKEIFESAFRRGEDLTLPVKTAASTINELPHGVKYFKSTQPTLFELAKEISAEDSLDVSMPDEDLILVERVGHIFAEGEWRAFSDILFIKRYSPAKGTLFAKKQINYYISNCTAEIEGDNGFPTEFLLPLYQAELASPDEKVEEGKGIPYVGSLADAKEFYLRSGCVVDGEEGDSFIVNEILGTQKLDAQKNLAAKYKITVSDGKLSFEILEVNEYIPEN